MIDILQKIIDLLISWIGYILPFVILGDDQVGLIRRFGVFHRYMKHGVNWKIPIVETPFAETSALDSTVLREQSLTTLDGVQVTLRGVITYRVIEPRKYILDCATAISVMNDVGCCVLAELIPNLESDVVLRGTEFQATLLKKVKLRARRWGVEIDSIGLIDRVATPTFRLITSASRRDDESSTPGMII